jgi:hypothetical protein
MHYYYWFTPVMAVIGLTIIFVVFYSLSRRRSSYTWYGSYRSQPVCGGPNVIVVDQGYVNSAAVVTPVIITNREPVQTAPVIMQANSNTPVVEKR